MTISTAGKSQTMSARTSSGSFLLAWLTFTPNRCDSRIPEPRIRAGIDASLVRRDGRTRREDRRDARSTLALFACNFLLIDRWKEMPNKWSAHE